MVLMAEKSLKQGDSDSLKVSKKSLKSPEAIRERLIEILLQSIEDIHKRLKGKYTPQKEKAKLRYALAYQISVLQSLLKEQAPSDDVERFLDELEASIKTPKKFLKEFVRGE